jgi:hypothetical protein
MSKGQASDRGSSPGTPQRGRPRIGEAKTVRLPDEELEFATHAGGGKFPEGVRIAVNTLMQLGRPLELTEEERAYASAYGGGAVIDGLQQLLREKAEELPLDVLRAQSTKRLLPPPDPLKRAFTEDVLEVAKKLGDGDAIEGFNRAARVAMVLGLDTFKRLDNGPAAPIRTSKQKHQ